MGNRGIGLELLGHRDQVGETGRDLRVGQPKPDAMERRVHDPERRADDAGRSRAFERGRVALEHFRRHGDDEPGARAESSGSRGTGSRRRWRQSPRQHLASCGGTICAPLPQDAFYPLYSGGIVARRDHHAGRRAEIDDRERGERRGGERVEEVRADARGGEPAAVSSAKVRLSRRPS